MLPMITLRSGPYIPYFIHKQVSNSINKREEAKMGLEHGLPRVFHLRNGLEMRGRKGCMVWLNEKLSEREPGVKAAL